jgi:hypothetical protein
MVSKIDRIIFPPFNVANVQTLVARSMAAGCCRCTLRAARETLLLAMQVAVE